VGPCKVCAKPAELRFNENSRENQRTTIIVVNIDTVFVSLFELVEALHTLPPKRLTAMQFSMRLQQKLDKLCRGYKLLRPRLTNRAYWRGRVPGVPNGVDAYG